NLNYTWEMSTWLSFFINLHHYTGITDRSLFSEHLSVKPRSKPLKYYGQTAVFDHFVRNRHFWNSPFTDSMPIFIDASVNNSDFAKCSAARQLLNRCT
ncbi:hypothetical protein, partial [Ligilactobacillus ruminis]|uniref:hypothetical protein n=1 Tax=Ligilactobacillus ruminis TaxID=1623 RepID=UPI00232D1D56